MVRLLVPLVVYGMIGVVYTTCCTPDLTWINADCDGFYYYAKAAYFVDWPSNVVWAGIGHLGTYLPGGQPWGVALVACAIPAVMSAGFIFLALRKQTGNGWAPYVGALAFAASPIVVAQATVHDVYSLATMFIAAAYLAMVYKKYPLVWGLLGAGWCVHWITLVPAVVAFLVWKRELVRWAWVGVPLFVLPFALQYVLGHYDTLDYWWGLQGVFLNGRIDNLPSRLMETGAIWLVGLGLAWIPAMLFLGRVKNSYPFLVGMGLPLCHLLTCPSVDGYVQSVGAMVFGAIAAGLGVQYVSAQWMRVAVVATSAVMLLAVPFVWDIGRTLDENPTTCRYWMDQVAETPEGSIIACSRRLDGAEDSIGSVARSGVYIIERETGSLRHYVYPNLYVSPDDYFGERARLASEGLVIPELVGRPDGMSFDAWCDANLVALARANGRSCYYSLVTEPEIFKCELVELS